MPIRLRQVPLLLYRLIFIAFLLALGIGGLGINILDTFAGINVFAGKAEVDQQALFATFGALGAISLIMAVTILYFMLEKRTSDTDRRQQMRIIDFPDRRVSADRRNSQPDCEPVQKSNTFV